MVILLIQKVFCETAVCVFDLKGNGYSIICLVLSQRQL